MKISHLFVLACILCAGCKNDSGNLASAEQQTIEYQTDDNQYAIVIVRSGEMNEEQAKELAIQKAAEKTRDQKLRYFTIESEDQVQAMRSGKSSNPPPSPSNMYYELIQSNNFGRDRFEDQQVLDADIYPAYRIVFKCYQEKPGESAVDACDIVSCDIPK